MPKVNVYLPDDLAAEAKAANLPTSQICQRAIREELDKMQATKAATGDPEAVAARLRATMPGETGDFHRGEADGAQWAREHATAAELEEIALHFKPGEGGDFDAGHSLVDFVAAKDGQNVASVSHEMNRYWIGFQTGAETVWDQVQPLLRRDA